MRQPALGEVNQEQAQIIKRICTACGEEKSLVDFSTDKRKPSGYSQPCSFCHNARTRKWSAAETAKGGRFWPYRLKRDFGLSKEDYLIKFEKQNGVCAICGETDSVGTWLAVDHDHACCLGNKSCGKCIRDLLCRNCNLLLGNCHEKIEILLSAIQYLRSHNGGDNPDPGDGLGANPVEPSVISCGNS